MIEARDLEACALDLRRTGLSYPRIAATLGCAVSTAYESVKRGIGRLTRETVERAEQVRALELERLDVLTHEMMAQALDQGLSPGLRQGAVDRVVKLAERRARLLGLDAPDQHRIFASAEQIAAKMSDEELDKVVRASLEERGYQVIPPDDRR